MPSIILNPANNAIVAGNLCSFSGMTGGGGTTPNERFSPLAITNNEDTLVFGALTDQDTGVTVYSIFSLNGSTLAVNTNLLTIGVSDPYLPKFSPDGSLLVVNPQQIIAKGQTGLYDRLVTFDQPLEPNYDLAISQDSEYIIAAVNLGLVQIYKRSVSNNYSKLTEITDANYFTGLKFSPDSTKLSFMPTMGAFRVYTFVNGEFGFIADYPIASDPSYPNKAFSSPQWVNDSLMAFSYMWYETGNVPFKGFLDIINVTNESVTLNKRDDAIGARYYGFFGFENGRSFTYSNGNGYSMIKINGIGVSYDVDYNDLQTSDLLLIPYTAEFIIPSMIRNKVERYTIAPNGTYTKI